MDKHQDTKIVDHCQKIEVIEYTFNVQGSFLMKLKPWIIASHNSFSTNMHLSITDKVFRLKSSHTP